MAPRPDSVGDFFERMNSAYARPGTMEEFKEGRIGNVRIVHHKIQVYSNEEIAENAIDEMNKKEFVDYTPSAHNCQCFASKCCTGVQKKRETGEIINAFILPPPRLLEGIGRWMSQHLNTVLVNIDDKKSM